MVDLTISDHALLRWMERAHGIDVELWRDLMRQEIVSALDAFDGENERREQAFVVSRHGHVITFLPPGHRSSVHDTIAVPRVT